MSKEDLMRETTRFQRLHVASQEAFHEAHRASTIWPAFHSVHEGAAVIAEEMCELWEECRRKKIDRAALRKEAIHTAAMALRFIAELSEEVEWVDNTDAPFKHLEPQLKPRGEK